MNSTLSATIVILSVALCSEVFNINPISKNMITVDLSHIGYHDTYDFLLSSLLLIFISGHFEPACSAPLDDFNPAQIPALPPLVENMSPKERDEQNIYMKSERGRGEGARG